MGTGINKIRTLLKVAGLTPPHFEFGDFYTIIFHREQHISQTVEKTSGKTLGKMPGKTPGKTSLQILKIISEQPTLTIPEIAKMIQTSLLPDISNITSNAYELDAIMIPAEEVGGDYFDLIKDTKGKKWYGIGDVTGHGLTSGLIMMMAQTAANAIIHNMSDLSPRDLIIKINNVLFQNIKIRLKVEYYMTMAFLTSDNHGNFEYAGKHLKIIIYRKKLKKCEILKTKGVWLGILSDITNQTYQAKFHLDKGDCFILYTDGVVEAMDKSRNQFDIPRLIECVEKYYPMGINKIIEGILTDVKEFMYQQKDDITLFAVMKK